MSQETEKKLMQEREYKVVKANEIIQKAKFDLGLLEQKTFCYAVSKIKPDDAPNTEYVFSINEYCDTCGINRNDGRTIENVKSALKRLRDKSFYLLEPDGSYVLIGWLSKAKVFPRSGKIKIKFDEDMQKYLIGLSNNFTQYNLLYILPMRSTYSIRLYELLKSYTGLRQRDKIFEVDELKAKLAAPYENFKDFRLNVLEKATKEINEYTDLTMLWEPITKGRKVIKVRFYVKEKDSFKKYLASKHSVDALEDNK